MVPRQVEADCASALQRIAADASRPRVAEASVEVVIAGSFVIRHARVEAGVDAKGQPVVGIDVPDKVEGVKAV